MSNSLTWQALPPNLLQMVLDGQILLWEAAWLLDEWLLTPPDSSRELPPQLHRAAQAMHLLGLEADQTLH